MNPVAVFAAAWAAIGFQLVSGHDPALAKNGQAAAVTSTSSGGTKSSADTSTGSTSTGSSWTGSSSTSAPQQLAPVTTQQS
jgi:hypothetical protein